MANTSSPDRGDCPVPFFQDTNFTNGGFVASRFCQSLTPELTCCLPCPMTDWVYPDSFSTIGLASQWVAVASTACCVFLLLSWLCLPVEKTFRHYLSICLTIAVALMSLGFVIPLAAKPDQCFDAITPNSMHNSPVCAASGTFLILGGWAGVLWVFMRALSLHLQICWQVSVGRSFMWFSQGMGWGIPAVGIVLAIVFSGVSFRLGTTCHINHDNSLADLWIPLLIFSGLTLVIQFATFGYCIKVYLASLSDDSTTTEGSGLPSYSNSIRTMTPGQAYRRVRRVIQLQWRGIAIVLIIISDVVFLSIVFVFQDNTVQAVEQNPAIAQEWVTCLVANTGDKTKCLDLTGSFVVNEATVGAVLLLLAVNGIWLLLLLGRWTMATGWVDLVTAAAGGGRKNKKEFVSVDARLDDLKKDTRSYEMLSRDREGEDRPTALGGGLVTPSTVTLPSAMRSRTETPVATPPAAAGVGPKGRRTPDYFAPAIRHYPPHMRSISNPRPIHTVTWDPTETYARPLPEDKDDDTNPLGMNRI